MNFVSYMYVDINECDDGTHTCVNAVCTNNEGGFNCTCHDGFMKLEETDYNCSKYIIAVVNVFRGRDVGALGIDTCVII